MGVVTWFTALTNQMHSARSVPHFTFRIPHSAIPHFTDTRTSVHRQIRWKNGPLALAFQDHSRSSKVMRFCRVSVTSHQWSIETMGLCRTVCDIHGVFCRK